MRSGLLAQPHRLLLDTRGIGPFGKGASAADQLQATAYQRVTPPEGFIVIGKFGAARHVNWTVPDAGASSSLIGRISSGEGSSQTARGPARTCWKQPRSYPSAR